MPAFAEAAAKAERITAAAALSEGVTRNHSAGDQRAASADAGIDAQIDALVARLLG